MKAATQQIKDRAAREIVDALQASSVFLYYHPCRRQWELVSESEALTTRGWFEHPKAVTYCWRCRSTHYCDVEIL